MVRTRVRTVTCPDCKDETFSRARYDYHLCECGATMVDGGFDYLRYTGKVLSLVVVRVRYVNATRRELYDDWNIGANKFGFIKKEKPNVSALRTR